MWGWITETALENGLGARSQILSAECSWHVGKRMKAESKDGPTSQTPTGAANTEQRLGEVQMLRAGVG
jgi:hypothetical protein